jgi:hypothetical protein
MKLSILPSRGILLIVVGVLTIGAPVTQAQMLGGSDTASALTSSLLQTTQQRQRRRHMPHDPYILLIEQNEPDRYLRELASRLDPLTLNSQTTLALGASSSSDRVQNILPTGFGLSGGMGELSGRTRLPGAGLSTDSTFSTSADRGVFGTLPMWRLPRDGCVALLPNMVSPLPSTAHCH